MTDPADLEFELDAVLARYRIPLELGDGADRGDLASDLADVARRVLTRGEDQS